MNFNFGVTSTGILKHDTNTVQIFYIEAKNYCHAKLIRN